MSIAPTREDIIDMMLTVGVDRKKVMEIMVEFPDEALAALTQIERSINVLRAQLHDGVQKATEERGKSK